MNDDFLHHIRAEPPPDFLAQLKSRLDLQPPPASAASPARATTPASQANSASPAGPANPYSTLEKLAADVLSRPTPSVPPPIPPQPRPTALPPQPTPPPPRRSLLRTLAISVLFAGAVFAITLLTLNREKAEPPFTVKTQALPHELPTPQHQDKTPGAPAKPSEVEKKQAASTNKSMITSAMITNLVAPKALVPYLTFALKKYGASPGIATTDSTAAALTEFCDVHDFNKSNVYPLLAFATRRINRTEFRACTRNNGPIAEVSLGHQVIVIARSKVYGTFSLTPTQIFLALAAEIPDPTQPGKLIPNSNTMWSDIDSTLEREPIEVYGPEPASPAALAFQEILFEPGCRAIPELATAKQCPKLRTDGVYNEVPDSTPDTQLKLQSKPNALGIIGYGVFELYSNLISASPIAGVVPSRETVANGTYPAARPLYLYVNQDTNAFVTRYLPSWLASAGGVVPDRFVILPPEHSLPWDPSALPPKLPDLTMQ